MPTLSIAFDLPFDQAIAAARQRRVTLPGTFYALPAEKRAQAFTVSGLAALDQVQGVLDELGRQLQAGGTLRDFQRWAAAQDLGLPRHRLETIYRNGVQQAYNAGHWRRFEEDAQARPYLMYDAINDSRTRPAHSALDGVIRPVGDAFWQTHSPSLGHRCLLPGTRVLGDFDIGMRTRYTGPAVEIRTAAGEVLSVTANHPVLTRRGWVAAGQLADGEDLLRHCGGVDWQLPGAVDDDQPPPTVEQVFEALGAQAAGVADVSAFDFHGDAAFGQGNVDIAGTNGLLMHGVQSHGAEGQQNRRLVNTAAHRVPAGGGEAAGLSFRTRVADVEPANQALDVGSGGAGQAGNLSRAHPRDVIEGFDLGFESVIARPGGGPGGATLPLDSLSVGFQLGPLQQLGSASSARLDAVAQQHRAECVPADPTAVGERFFTGSGQVLSHQRCRVVGRPAPGLAGAALHQGARLLERAALHPRIAQQAAEEAPADGELFQQLHDGFSGDVAADQIVSIRHFTFDGHVYDFQTRQGWMFAGGVIVSNCRCRLISLSPDEARNRGGVTQHPPAEGRADEGWGVKPTGQSEQLAGVVRERQAACRIDGPSFSRRKRDPAQNIDCTEYGAALLAGLAPGENGGMLPPAVQRMLDGLIARGLAARASGFAALWVGERSLSRHAAKRIAQGDVVDADDYERATLAFLAGAQELMLITPVDPKMHATGKLGIVGREWLVLLSADGGIVTSYQIKPGMVTVRERHILAGDRVEDFPIPDDIRKSLAAVFHRG